MTEVSPIDNDIRKLIDEKLENLSLVIDELKRIMDVNRTPVLDPIFSAIRSDKNSPLLKTYIATTTLTLAHTTHECGLGWYMSFGGKDHMVVTITVDDVPTSLVDRETGVLFADWYTENIPHEKIEDVILLNPIFEGLMALEQRGYLIQKSRTTFDTNTGLVRIPFAKRNEAPIYVSFELNTLVALQNECFSASARDVNATDIKGEKPSTGTADPKSPASV